MAFIPRRRRAWGIVALLAIAAIMPACYTRSFIHNSDISSQLASDRDRWLKEEPWNVTFDDAREPGKAPNADDKYGQFQENPFQWTEREPRIAFSINAGTDSISALRTMLGEGKFPPKDAVRVAEIVNSCDYTYPSPATPHPVGMTLEVGPCPWNEKHRLVRIALKAMEFHSEMMPPRNYTFLIDNSISMVAPNRLPLIKSSLHALVDGMTEQDRISFVTYGGQTAVLLPPTPGSQKQVIYAVIDGLAVSNSNTEGSPIKRAYEQAARGFIKGGVNRVIVVTDGLFKVGATQLDVERRDRDGPVGPFIEAERGRGILLTVLGFGMPSVHDREMRRLAQFGDGSCARVDSLEDARRIFVNQGGALVRVAKDARIEAEFNPKFVTASRLIGHEKRLLKPEGVTIIKREAEDLGSGEALTALFEVVPTELNGPNQGEWMNVKFSYKKPEDGTSQMLRAALTEMNPRQELSADFKLAAAAAEFGLALRGSPYRVGADYAKVLERIQKLKRPGRETEDPSRDNLARLVQQTMAIAPAQR